MAEVIVHSWAQDQCSQKRPKKPGADQSQLESLTFLLDKFPASDEQPGSEQHHGRLCKLERKQHRQIAARHIAYKVVAASEGHFALPGEVRGAIHGLQVATEGHPPQPRPGGIGDQYGDGEVSHQDGQGSTPSPAQEIQSYQQTGGGAKLPDGGAESQK